jgi:hypothetical protein
MRRILMGVCGAAVALALTAGPAAADRSQARNYEEIPVTCEGLGEVVVEVVNLGNWGTGKVQGTQLTLIPRTFTFTATNVATGEVVFDDQVAKRNANVDDVCTASFLEEVEDDPFLEPGTYLVEFSVGVRVVGP